MATLQRWQSPSFSSEDDYQHSIKVIVQAMKVVRIARDQGWLDERGMPALLTEESPSSVQSVPKVTSLPDNARALLVACDEGAAEACTDLSRLYRRGEGVSKDDAQAAQLARRGCDGGDARGCTDLGFRYLRGQGVERDVERAVALIRRGCDGGNAEGCSEFGTLYEGGEGIEQDLARAKELYKQGCEGGNTFGCDQLTRLTQLNDEDVREAGERERENARADWAADQVEPALSGVRSAKATSLPEERPRLAGCV